MVRPEIDYETISKEDALKFYQQWGDNDGKWKQFIEEFVASKKPAIEMKAGFNKENPHAIMGKRRKEMYPNVKVISRSGRVFLMNLALLPELRSK